MFIPRPRVESVLVRMQRKEGTSRFPPKEVTYERLAAVVQQVFGQRRKMLRELLGQGGRALGKRTLLASRPGGSG